MLAKPQVGVLRMDWITDFRTRVDDVGWSARVVFNEFMKFNLVGCFNSAFGFLLYYILYQINLWDAHTAVAAWVVSSIIGNIEAHFMHYKFTFKSTFKYSTSLNRAFWCYTGLLVITTSMEYLLIELWHINHYLAWLFNTCVFGFLNFVLIRWLAFPPEHDIEMV